MRLTMRFNETKMTSIKNMASRNPGFWAGPKFYKLVLQVVKIQMAVTILESSLGPQHPAKANQL